MTKKKRERTVSILSSSLLLEAPASKSARFKSRRLHITEPISIQPFVANGLFRFYRKEMFDMFEAGYRWYAERNLPIEK